MVIPADAIGIFPVCVAGIRYATAQLVGKEGGKVYLMQVKGVPVEIAFEDGKVIRNAKPRGTGKPIYKHYYLLTIEEAEQMGKTVKPFSHTVMEKVPFERKREAGPLRTITIGVNKVAEEPTDADFNQAAVYTISLPDSLSPDALLDINYHGDCARLYANGKLIDDNFYNGRHFQYGLWRLPKNTQKLELRILPMQKDEPVYFPQEADTTPGEGINSIKILSR